MVYLTELPDGEVKMVHQKVNNYFDVIIISEIVILILLAATGSFED
jgi:hypothetical protein